MIGDRTVFDDVADFQTAMGQEPGIISATNQVAMIVEEFGEFCRAVGLSDLAADAFQTLAAIRGGDKAYFGAVATAIASANDYPKQRVEQLDGAVDLIYVAAGFVNAVRCDGRGAWDAVQRSNMAKLWPDGTVRRDAMGKVVKPLFWSAPDLAPFIHKPEGGSNE